MSDEGAALLIIAAEDMEEECETLRTLAQRTSNKAPDEILEQAADVLKNAREAAHLLVEAYL